MGLAHTGSSYRLIRERTKTMDLFLSVADASRILGVIPQTVRLMIRRGTLRVTAKTVGGIQLLRQEDVTRLAAVRAQRPGDGGAAALADRPAAFGAP
jgi:hypothetical protein